MKHAVSSVRASVFGGSSARRMENQPCDRFLRLVDDLLDVSRITQGRIELPNRSACELLSVDLSKDR